MTANPATIERILNGLERGRRNAIAAAKERAVETQRAVREELDRDILANKPERGEPRGSAGGFWRSASANTSAEASPPDT